MFLEAMSTNGHLRLRAYVDIFTTKAKAGLTSKDWQEHHTHSFASLIQ